MVTRCQDVMSIYDVLRVEALDINYTNKFRNTETIVLYKNLYNRLTSVVFIICFISNVKK